MKKIINLIILIALIVSNFGTRADKDLSGAGEMADKSGMQTKTITVKSNASTPVVILKIIAEVTSTNK